MMSVGCLACVPSTYDVWLFQLTFFIYTTKHTLSHSLFSFVVTAACWYPVYNERCLVL